MIDSVRHLPTLYFEISSFVLESTLFTPIIARNSFKYFEAPVVMEANNFVVGLLRALVNRVIAAMLLTIMVILRH